MEDGPSILSRYDSFESCWEYCAAESTCAACFQPCLDGTGGLRFWGVEGFCNTNVFGGAAGLGFFLDVHCPAQVDATVPKARGMQKSHNVSEHVLLPCRAAQGCQFLAVSLCSAKTADGCGARIWSLLDAVFSGAASRDTALLFWASRLSSNPS